MKIDTICQCCSAGCRINLLVETGTQPTITGEKGVVNSDGFFCNRATNGYSQLFNSNRISQPLLKTSMGFRRISFDEAFLLIEEHIAEELPEQNAFFGGSGLSNEELYLIQKMARVGVRTSQISSFHYLGRGNGYLENTKSNIPVTEIMDTQVVILIGDALPELFPWGWQVLLNARRENNVEIYWLTTSGMGPVSTIADVQIHTGSYYSFLKLVNRSLIENNKTDALFTEDICLDYSSYRDSLLAEDREDLFQQARVNNKQIDQLISLLFSGKKSVLLFTEKDLSGNASREVHHLAMLTGKLGRYSDGLIAIREGANSQGLVDMGIDPVSGPGAIPTTDSLFLGKAREVWNIEHLPEPGETDIFKLLSNPPRNLFIFGDDPIGRATEHKAIIENYISKSNFSVVQDFTLTATAQLAELVLPATYLFESGGTITNTQKIIQQVKGHGSSVVGMTGFEQLSTIASRLGLPPMTLPAEAMLESVMMFPSACSKKQPRFVYTATDDFFRL